MVLWKMLQVRQYLTHAHEIILGVFLFYFATINLVWLKRLYDLYNPDLISVDCITLILTPIAQVIHVLAGRIEKVERCLVCDMYTYQIEFVIKSIAYITALTLWSGISYYNFFPNLSYFWYNYHMLSMWKQSWHWQYTHKTKGRNPSIYLYQVCLTAIKICPLEQENKATIATSCFFFQEKVGKISSYFDSSTTTTTIISTLPLND